ncbi:site-specific DNA-methyltransferase [Moraxella bovis]|nr:site-specific DNA-methyltransferase [Moraxella bovis]UZA05674.1 site-specific DNA-methyltransferase [Moraxella bovis]UZA07894.1 site-specific DNA-methyltransferase [Moraxella bovis]UZA54801.1 site-specific DNA-methyltransferase [Moraxella bovis]
MNQQSAISNQQSAISNQQSAISNQQSAISNQQSLKTAHNTDFFGEKLAKLRQILPEIFSEHALDLEKLKTLLGDHLAQNERYGLNWAGKSTAYQALQAPTNNTLMPCPAESVDFDTTQNIFIESDNLEALKILQKSYAGKIKMIYIDPPYNTGNDFIYHDDFSQSKKDYEVAIGDRDIHGKLLKSFKKNSKDNGHYHSNWLNMMLPRLHLAHTLLSDDGVIFISIDDHEQAQLKLLCDEIFGGENFVADIIWNSTKSVTNTALISVSHTYNLVYFKDIDYFIKNRELFRLKDDGDGFENPDNDPRGAWKADPFQVGGWRPNQQYIITNPNTGVEYTPNEGSSWKNDYEKFQELLNDNRIVFGKNGTSAPQRKRFIWEAQERGKVAKTLWDDVETTTNGTQLLKRLFNEKSFFDNPKPISLIKRMLELGSDNKSIILDFFAGSATTAHAVMQLNSEDNGNRQFIMVQLPELTDEKSEAHKAGFKTISDISKERIRRAGAKIKAENPEKKIDTGFKVFKLSDSNFKAWQIDDDISKQLEMYIDPLKDNTNEVDIVYELLLKMGLKLTADIKFDNGIYWLTCENKSYAIVLNSLSQDEFNAIIDKKPAKTVVLDKVFLNDSEKSNVILQFKDAGLNFESI